MPIDFTQTISTELGVRPQQVARSIALFDDDNTVPFVARYRKEVTGGLDETQLRAILERLTYLRHLAAPSPRKHRPHRRPLDERPDALECRHH